ncbi:hypothetical protein [Chondromyces crocatus]|uniref:Uncharacterized protein n=1 Tax=Chondromyces crocatus TaxID=52 RepID=A0A0K1EMG6_CHOCO|nr:hypothetical protein [Chondromyces crocatus]AKT42016.1 uncharacterized protein CMC5_062380 [Chondromyces crocatus]
MLLFETLLQSLLVPDCKATLTRSDDGHPAFQLSTGGTVILEPSTVMFDDAEPEDAPGVVDLGPALRRIHDFLARFPIRVEDSGIVAVFTLHAPTDKPLWSDEGLRATVRQQSSKGEQTFAGSEAKDLLLIDRATLARDDWRALLDAFDERTAEWAGALECVFPEHAALVRPVPVAPTVEATLPPDEGWDDYAASLGIDDPEALAARVARHAEAAYARFPSVRDHYEATYGLKLPRGLAYLSALFAALGELPEDPPEHYIACQPGRSRSHAWTDSALGMRLSGLSEWFLPDALQRKTKDAARLHDEDQVPPGAEGPLDPRLDMRYRRDAPQFVTFLSGNSDGKHWGFWYDSPDHFPVIASNYARDSAETWLAEEPEIADFLRATFDDALRESLEHLDDDGESEENLRFYRNQLRALRVIQAHLDALDTFDAEQPPEDEPLCPWPRTERNPVGSPRLALRPDTGPVPDKVPGFSFLHSEDPDTDTLKTYIAEARRELAEGRPAYAHALGLYLHWCDDDALRDEAGSLLLHAYEALGFRPFAAILKVHLLHRDLASVGVFED